MDYYIHYADPGFPEEPFPGERRSGPYPQDAALEQAINDVASGYGVPVGIYTEDESLKRVASTARSKGKAFVTSSVIKEKGQAEARRRKKEDEKARANDLQALVEILPAGMGVEEAAELLVTHRDKVANAMRAALEAAAEEEEQR